jgi:hypothetical protein
MSDNNSTVDNDALTIDEIDVRDVDSNDFVMKIDMEKYMAKRKNKETKCTYCRKVDLYGNGMLSVTAKNNISDRTEPPVYFCCECCSNMYKHETGICRMPEELFKDTFKRAYPAMYAKRYSV